MSVRAVQTAEVGALTGADARQEEAHPGVGVLRDERVGDGDCGDEQHE